MEILGEKNERRISLYFFMCASALSEAVDANADKIEEYIRLLIEETKADAADIQEKSFYLNEFMGSIEKQCSNLCRIQRIPVVVEKLSARHIVYADSELLQRAVINLIVNGAAHTKKSEGIKVTLSYEAGIFRAQVEDFGQGFTQEALKHCKEQFYTENAERGGDHYGMGMYFADKVAQRYGGKLEYINKQNRGGAVVIFTARLG